MWSDIWSKAATRDGCWTLLWSTNHFGWCRKWLVDFNAEKTQLLSFGRSHNTGATGMKKHEFVLEEKSSLKMLWLTFSLLNWTGTLTLPLLLKLLPRKLEPWFALWGFFLLRLLYISMTLHGILLSCLDWCS